MEWLNFHHLRYFWAAAKEGSLRAAAQKLGVSQPSISAQLKLLEDALGHPLFRRVGRGLALTDTGRMVLDYADDIFRTGRELLQAVRQGGGATPPVFHVGVSDSLPKLVVRGMLEPALKIETPPRLICREGLLGELLPLLAAHRIDMILADEPAPASQYRLFNHPLGSCGVTFCAAPKLAARLRKDFPRSLHGAPALLPAEGTPLRRAVEQWFDARGLEPKILGEFDDGALMMMFARDGLGFLPIHSVAAADGAATFRLSEVGNAPECRCHLHAITAERRLKHPAILAVTVHAQESVFGPPVAKKARAAKEKSK
jgi:LysR family transcriptional regulator, transcriptional activator of nhaA